MTIATALVKRLRQRMGVEAASRNTDSRASSMKIDQQPVMKRAEAVVRNRSFLHEASLQHESGTDI